MGIHDPNFFWILLLQFIGGMLIFIIGSFGIYKLLDRLRPKTNRALKIILTLVIAVILVCATGLLSDQFDN